MFDGHTVALGILSATHSLSSEDTSSIKKSAIAPSSFELNHPRSFTA
jgi:hypothetical protein